MALTPDEIDGLRELILAVYGPVTEELLRDLCRCITAAGQISSGDEYKLLLATKTPEEAVRRATLRLWQQGIRTIRLPFGWAHFFREFMAQRALWRRWAK